MSRIRSVDLVRVVAIFAVITIHTNPFESASVPIAITFDLGLFLNQLARFAVPFFFVISGFFWASKFDDNRLLKAPTVRMAKRIAAIFFAWSAIYFISSINYIEAFQYGPLGPVKAIYWNAAAMLGDPITLIFQGTKVHLWFLVSLLTCLAISAIFLRNDMKRCLIALSLILYTIGLAGKAYADTPTGFHIDFNFRNGPFFGLVFFVSGYMLQRKGPRKSWLSLGLLLATFGFFLQFFELLTLRYYWGTAMYQDYVIGTYFAGVGVALIALSDAPLLRFKLLSSVGPLVLGIYAIHFIFVQMLHPFDEKFSGAASWELGYPVAVFMLSTSAVYVMSRFRLTRAIVV